MFNVPYKEWQMNGRFTFIVGDATHAFTITIERDNSNWRQILIITTVPN